LEIYRKHNRVPHDELESICCPAALLLCCHAALLPRCSAALLFRCPAAEQQNSMAAEQQSSRARLRRDGPPFVQRDSANRPQIDRRSTAIRPHIDRRSISNSRKIGKSITAIPKYIEKQELVFWFMNVGSRSHQFCVPCAVVLPPIGERFRQTRPQIPPRINQKFKEILVHSW
jgi:hypothetical protein